MVTAGSPRLLGEILVQEGLITPDVVERALARSQSTGELIGEALVALGAVTADDILRALAQQHGLPFMGPDELPSALPVLKAMMFPAPATVPPMLLFVEPASICTPTPLGDAAVPLVSVPIILPWTELPELPFSQTP